MRVLTRELAARAAELRIARDVAIVDSVDRLVTSVGGRAYRFHELYGTFQGMGCTASALYDGISTPVEVAFHSAGQVNVRLVHRNRMCTLRLQRGDAPRSLELRSGDACADPEGSGVCP